MRIGYKRINLTTVFFLAAVGCFIYLLFTSWLKWGNLIVDTSRELWMPLQILEGRVIYKDLFHEYGFLPPYVLALVYKIFGVSIYSLVGAGVGITALMTILLYKISRFFLNEAGSFLVIITFMFVFAFGYYSGGIFNFILPYSFAATFFILFITAALYYFLKFIYYENGKNLLGWGGFLVCAFLCRGDMSLPVWAGFVLAGEFFILKTNRKKFWQFNLYLIAPFFISILCYVLFIIKMQAFVGFKESVLDLVKFGITKNDVINISWIGLDNVALNSYLIIKSFILHIIVILLLGIGAVSISSFFLNKKEESNFVLSLGGVIIIIFSFILAWNLLGKNFLQYRSLVLLLLIGMCLFFWRMIHGGNFKKNIACFSLFLISFLTIARIILKTTPYGYGFYMMSLSIICYYIFFFQIVKEVVEKIRINNFSMLFFQSLLFCLFLFLVNPYWSISSYLYALKNVKVDTEMGSIFCFPEPKTLRYWEAVEYLIEHSSVEDTVVVVPEGVGINFYSGRKNPLRYYTFVPPCCERTGEEKMIDEIKSHDIDYFVIIHRPTSEYGYAFFGIDYGRKISAWINQNYEIIKQFGPMPFTSNEFGIAILKRKS
ncbi:MAG: glycosyltransferase family 39 protein [Candidatus Saelkia tenebricola]|nr:glycosyltransferase family 39 protein [Candidatus Saelkia tenebricola]